MDEFEIEFTDVPQAVQAEIRNELKALNPPKDCISDFSFIVQRKNGAYWLGYQTDNKKGVPARSDLTEPKEIATALKQLTHCW
jgi:hypothetical protein